MGKITHELLRKRAEHNEGMISTLEEITLHQEEIEKIEVIGTTCRHLKILYLQNNVIGRLENLHHLKQLEYLNLAMNNIPKIEGLGSCEFLNKLDMTLNFVDFDELEASIVHLQPLVLLRELFMMGNPGASDWPGFERYAIAMLPQLEFLEGRQISRSDRILASQEFEALQEELRDRAASCRARKAAALAARGGAPAPDLEYDPDAPSEHTPDVRLMEQRQSAKEKQEKADREAENQPRKRNFESEHKAAVEKARERERAENGKEVMQCNEAKLEFAFDEHTVPGSVVLSVGVPRYLDSSMLDVDCHPAFVSIVVKNKTLRLRWPEEVVSAQCVAQRSKTTGDLVLTAPCQDPSSIARSRLERARAAAEDAAEAAAAAAAKLAAAKPKLLDEMVAEAASKAVDIRGIVGAGGSGGGGGGRPGISARPPLPAFSGGGGGVAPTAAAAAAAAAAATSAPAAPADDDDDAPPLM
jgi:protein TilB